jgi:5-methyltetrahydrofolate--homocysteine methyltransferase
MSSAPIITDGAWGTELQAQGLGGGEYPDTWNLTDPAAVRGVAASYAAAGSRIVLTNTFRANRIALERAALADQLQAINRAGVELSREGVAGRAKVFASIGPSGAMLATGDVSEDSLRTAFTEQAEVLASAGADGLVIETMSDVDEAAIATQAARATGLPVVVCMVYDSGRNKDRTMMGTTPEQAAARLMRAGADVIGANCGCGIEGYIAIAARLRAATNLPIWIKANAGLPEFTDGRLSYRMTPEQFAAHARRLDGVTYIGGCCGTNPDFIRALAATCV